MEQRTEEWFAARLGKVTASRVADVVARTKSGYGASRARANYMAELVCERLTGVWGDFFQSTAMKWGTEQEPAAREAYENKRGVLVLETGFVPHPTITMAGASPDGLVGTEGGIEIKCPNTNTHLDTLLSEKVPERYLNQIYWQMACTGGLWVDFVSFDPRLPDAMQLYIQRVPRDDAAIRNLESEVSKFLAELDEKVSLLKAKYGEF